MRKIIPLACVMAFLMSFDGVDVFIKQADPHLKALLGAGLFFFVWLLILWDDLLQPGPERPAVAMNDHGPMAETIRRCSNSRTSTYKLHVRTEDGIARILGRGRKRRAEIR